MELPYWLRPLTPLICFGARHLRVTSKMSVTLCAPHSTPLQAHYFGANVNDKIKEVQESMLVACATRRFQTYPQQAPRQQPHKKSYPRRK